MPRIRFVLLGVMHKAGVGKSARRTPAARILFYQLISGRISYLFKRQSKTEGYAG